MQQKRGGFAASTSPPEDNALMAAIPLVILLKDFIHWLNWSRNLNRTWGDSVSTSTAYGFPMKLRLFLKPGLSK